MFYERSIKSTLANLEQQFPAILITGPRQVGKSSLLKNYFGDKCSYVSLDDFVLRQQAKNDPRLFLSKYELPIIIDEIQYAPELMVYIKIIIDEQRINGMFWLTGSQKFELMRDISETLAGRIAILDLLGLSQSEIAQTTRKTEAFLPSKRYQQIEYVDINTCFYRIWRGSYPELYRNKNLEWDRFYASYIQTYLERDIRNLTQVADEQKFMRFLTVIASRTAQMLNYNSISKEVGVTGDTIKKWISILETSGVVYLLKPYYNNIAKRAIKTPKIYFLDTGLCAYLTAWQTAQTLEKGAMSGAFFETYIISELIKSYWHHGKSTKNIYYYRDKDGAEIDVLIEENGQFYPMEIKKKSNPNLGDIKSFSALNKFNQPIESGAVICLCDDWYPLDEKVNAINIGAI